MAHTSQSLTPIQWVLVLACLLVVLLIAGLTYTYFSDRAELQRAAAETACDLRFERASTDWQACLQTG